MYVYICAITDFNPRSHERSDQRQEQQAAWLSYFNPRSHERSDVNAELARQKFDISIHAPTRGATEKCGTDGGFRLFQSTLPREERHFRGDIIRSMSNFNPRSHERSDLVFRP